MSSNKQVGMNQQGHNLNVAVRRPASALITPSLAHYSLRCSAGGARERGSRRAPGNKTDRGVCDLMISLPRASRED